MTPDQFDQFVTFIDVARIAALIGLVLAAPFALLVLSMWIDGLHPHPMGRNGRMRELLKRGEKR